MSSKETVSAKRRILSFREVIKGCVTLVPTGVNILAEGSLKGGERGLQSPSFQTWSGPC